MGLFDTFYTDHVSDIQVKMYDCIMTNYKVGDYVPDTYGENYNIFPYHTENHVIIIRNGVFVDAIDYRQLRDDEVFGIKCFDKYGKQLKLKSPKDYAKLKMESGGASHV